MHRTEGAQPCAHFAGATSPLRWPFGVIASALQKSDPARAGAQAFHPATEP
jgi:hypothetical protein